MAAGCSKKMDCPIQDPHAHKYVNSNGLFEYVQSEDAQDGMFSDFRWTNETVPLTNKIVNEDKFGLLSIKDNSKVLTQMMMNNTDYIEFEYKYEWTTDEPQYAYDNDGNRYVDHYDTVHHTDYRWTNNNNQSDLTGKARNITYLYKGYRIVLDEKGNPKTQVSELTDNIFNIAAQYPYFNASDWCNTVYSNNYNLGYDSTYTR
jgi:hypothetical protein